MLPQELLNIQHSVQEASAATNEAQLLDTTASDSVPVEMAENKDSVSVEIVENKDSISVKPVENKDRRGNVPEKTNVQEHGHAHDNSYPKVEKNLSVNEAEEITVESLDIQQFSPSVVLEKALIQMKQAELVSKIDSASYVYFTDTGGQPGMSSRNSCLLSWLDITLF